MYALVPAVLFVLGMIALVVGFLMFVLSMLNIAPNRFATAGLVVLALGFVAAAFGFQNGGMFGLVMWLRSKSVIP